MKSLALRRIWADGLCAALLCVVTLLGHSMSASPIQAQDDFGIGTDLFPNLSLNGFGEQQEEPVELSAQYFSDADGQGRLQITAELSRTWHIYSTTQKPGGPTPTKITVVAPTGAQLVGPFTPDRAPASSVSALYNGLTIEEHDGTVVWSAPIKLPSGFVGNITVDFNGLVCKSGGDNRCMPVDEQLTATHAESASSPGADSSEGTTAVDGVTLVADADQLLKTQPEAAAKPFRDGKYVVQWTAVVSPSKLVPGQSGVLQFTANPDPTFHVYKSVVDDSESSTNFVLTDKNGLLVGKPVANKEIVTKTILPSLPPISYYDGKVTWQLPFKVPADASPGEKTLEGMIAYQACTDNSCHRPTALKFTVPVTVADTTDSTSAAIIMASAKSRAALDAAASTKWVDSIELADESAAVQPADDPDLAALPAAPVAPGTTSSPTATATTAAAPTASSTTSFPLILAFAFLGGLILNVMPCVLPVVGLKIMGFVSQAGEDRGRILVLNLVYVLGIMAVFAIFAGVAAVSKFGWGEQFTYFPVRLGLTMLLFALALSYLGVWEIPAPGMAAGKTSQDLQNREGLVGAFSKGVFATILATPCSGPLLGYILGLTLNLSPGHTIAIFLMVGLGMSSPYLLIGVQPKLVTWLPKPGPWMETLKQLMAFLFLGTVAFFFSQFSDTQKVPVFVSLIAVWFGCWIIGQVPNWAEMQKRLMAWTAGITVAALISVWAFNYLTPDYELAWEDYSEPRLQQLHSEGRTVLLDFGAKWCGTCIYNYEIAINTEETRKVVDELNAVALYADWTDYSEEIKQKLEELDSRSIPLLAIYPGDDPGNPIILRDLVTQDAVIDALRQAGASIDKRSASIGSTATSMAVTRH